METTSCSLCHNNSAHLELEAKDWLHGSQQTFRLVRCAGCGLIYVNPRPTKNEIARYYQSSYYSYQRADCQDWIRPEHNRLAAQLTYRFGKPGVMLDVGCGDGSFMRAMRERGWQVMGTEIHAPTAESLRSQGLAVQLGTLDTLNLPQNHFDLVVMLEVLEHTHDPGHTMRQVRTLLRSAGITYITVPNIASFEYRLCRANWVALEPPIHLYHFNPTTLVHLLKSTGFTIESIRTSSSVAGLTRSLWLMTRFATSGRSMNIHSPGSPTASPSWRQKLHPILNHSLMPLGLVLSLANAGPGLQALARPT